MKKMVSIFTLIMMLATMSTLFLSVAVVGHATGEESTDFEIGFETDNEGNLELIRGGTARQEDGTAWGTFITKYRGFITGVSGIGAVTMLGVFIVNFIKLGTYSTSNKRSDIITGLIWSGIATAGLGAVAFIVGFFYNTIV